MKTLVLGTRGSTLALTQSRTVARALEAASGVKVELEIISTRGDRQQDRPLPEIGGKGLFTAELDRALLDGDIQLAVHSLKDLPTDQHPDLALGCVPERVDPRDVLVGPSGASVSLKSLPSGAVVGTSSLRRRALALAFRPDVDVQPVRGNLDTRLDKVDAGVCDALILAAAGVVRLGRENRIGEWLEKTSWLPAPAQGALAIVTRADDVATLEALRPLHHAPTAAAVLAERTFLAALEGGCQVPIGAVALPYGPGLRLWGLVASTDGRRVVRDDLTGEVSDPEALGLRLAESVRTRGATEILMELEAAAPQPDPR
jgi:hydroxymethylbilane synthase